MTKKVELIPEWRLFAKFWSVRLSLLGSALLSLFLAFPDALIYAWNMTPPDLKEHLPVDWAKWIPVVLVVAGAFARVVKQRKLENANPTAERQIENQ